MHINRRSLLSLFRLSSVRSLNEFGLTSVNTFTSYLKSDDGSFTNRNDDDNGAVLATSSSIETLIEEYVTASNIDDKQSKPRQVYRAHYSYVVPEVVPSPALVCASTSCCQTLGLDLSEVFASHNFVLVFSGLLLLDGLNRPYSTNYGSHVYGKYKGQLGDGRVMSLGDVVGDDNKRYELQLKGAGRTPYGRGFDGRAVLRSCVREYLVSEAMHHLNVETTRSLSVISTGMQIRRPWYRENSSNVRNDGIKNSTRRGPDVVIYEPGAILCRLSSSFIRFGQIELFAVREEYAELLQLVNFAIFKEYPSLLAEEDFQDASFINKFHNPSLYVDYMREVCKSSAKLVADWFRVGYCHGNLNSDNVLTCGKTVDYGPNGFMEMYSPSYQPFTADTTHRKYSFHNQSLAMSVNIKTLGQCMKSLITHFSNESNINPEPFLDVLRTTVTSDYEGYYADALSIVKASKLGLRKFDDKIMRDEKIWDDLLSLLHRSKADYTIFFRELSKAADSAGPNEAFLTLQNAFYFNEGNSMPADLRTSWSEWLDMYLQRVRADNMEPTERKQIQNMANPKYVPRNWMLMLAYEQAEKGDYSLIKELHELFSHPYDEQSELSASKYYIKTPIWAQNLAGSEFLN